MPIKLRAVSKLLVLIDRITPLRVIFRLRRLTGRPSATLLKQVGKACRKKRLQMACFRTNIGSANRVTIYSRAVVIIPYRCCMLQKTRVSSGKTPNILVKVSRNVVSMVYRCCRSS